MKNQYDKMTYALIKQLALLKKDPDNKSKHKFTEVDNEILKQLINGDIDYEQIQEEKKRCAENPQHFIDKQIYVKNKFENPDTIPEILKNRVVGDRIKFVMYDIQRDLVNAIFDDDKVISTKSRQIGFTTTTLACATQLISFNNNKTILLFSKSEKDAKDTLTELKFMYDNLPFFLRRTEYRRNEKELGLGNRMNTSKIIVQTTGKSSGRSHSATWIVFDEGDYIQSIEEIYKAALFTISATKGKIIVLSTPNLHGSQFQRMVKGARNKQNGFTLIEGEWNTIPWRDQAQYDEQCQLLNYDKKSIATELDMKQILPYDNYFDEKKLMSIKNQKVKELICGSVEMYTDVKEDHNYIIAVDCQEEGSHFNGIVVLDLETGKICASMRTRMNIFDTLVELSKHYNHAKLMIERNRGFYLIKKFEENEMEHLLLPNIKYVAKTDKYEFDLDKEGQPNKLGFVTLKNTRGKLLMHLSEHIHKAKELPKELIEEAETFVIKRGKPVGLETDDLLITTGIGLMTAAVIEETRLLSKGDRKLLQLLNSYQGKSLENRHKARQKQLNNNINEQINQMSAKAHSLLSDSMPGLHELQMLDAITKSNMSSKISKALKFGIM